jgi:dolichol kinase
VSYFLRLRIEGHLTFKIYLIIKGLLVLQYELYHYLSHPLLLLIFFCVLFISLLLIPIPNTQMTLLSGRGSIHLVQLIVRTSPLASQRQMAGGVLEIFTPMY